MIMIEWGDMGSQSPRIRCVDKYVVLDLDILCLVSTNHAGNKTPQSEFVSSRGVSKSLRTS